MEPDEIIFQNRKDAGERLARKLLKYRDAEPIVLGLPRGGLPVAYEVARALEAPLDVWVVRKVGAPFQPELGLGAVAEGGVLYLDHDTLRLLGASETEVVEIAERKAVEVEERVRRFRRGHPPPVIRGRTAIIVDDGIATGGTVRAAVRALRQLEPAWLVVATPVAAEESLQALRPEVDDVVCLETPSYLGAIGAWYEDFTQVQDHEVEEFLEHARLAHAAAQEGAPAPEPPAT